MQEILEILHPKLVFKILKLLKIIIVAKLGNRSVAHINRQKKKKIKTKNLFSTLLIL